MAWILALLGIWLSFGVKFFDRKNKDNTFDFVFWFKDNWLEVMVTLNLVIILMIIYTNPGTIVNEEFFQEFKNKHAEFLNWIDIPSKLVIPVVIGYYSNWLVYKLVKKKVDESK